MHVNGTFNDIQLNLCCIYGAIFHKNMKQNSQNYICKTNLNYENYFIINDVKVFIKLHFKLFSPVQLSKMNIMLTFQFNRKVHFAVNTKVHFSVHVQMFEFPFSFSMPCVMFDDNFVLSVMSIITAISSTPSAQFRQLMFIISVAFTTTSP